MPDLTATAVACANIALIKYWGNCDESLRLAANSSLSMNLDSLETRTEVHFDPQLSSDDLEINAAAAPAATQRLSAFLDVLRALAGTNLYAHVSSQTHFPMDAGLASSAAAFAALALAAATALGLQLSEAELSRLARRGSGSACRSIPGGFVEWQAGATDADSLAFSIAPPQHWNLADCIAIVASGHKTVSSSAGHSLANSSILQASRIADTPRRLDLCRQAILRRDFEALCEVVELDCNLMHAVMLTSHPPLIYWEPATLALIHAVQDWRRSGLPVCYTIDAGANVHVLTPAESASLVQERLTQIPGVQRVLVAHPGPPARLVPPTPGL